MSDVLIVKVNAMLAADDLNNLKLGIEEMKKSGVILLPEYCEVFLAPDDCKIKIKDHNGNEIEKHVLCKYYKRIMDKIVDEARLLYEKEGWHCGGYLHILLDDGNTDDESIKHCIKCCEEHPEDPWSANGIYICKEFLKLSKEERVVCWYLISNWNGICEINRNCKECIFIDYEKEE